MIFGTIFALILLKQMHFRSRQQRIPDLLSRLIRHNPSEPITKGGDGLVIIGDRSGESIDYLMDLFRVRLQITFSMLSS